MSDSTTESGFQTSEYLGTTAPANQHDVTPAPHRRYFGTAQSGLAVHWHQGRPWMPPIRRGRRATMWGKRAVDIGLSAAALLVLSPVLLGVAAAVRLTSPGPSLFRQQRIGLGNRPFEVLKFRTMRTDCADPTGVAQTRAGDPRITPIGRLLRKTSIDELPQLINVLRGEMSLVGPRPHVPGMLAGGVRYEELVPYYEHRHSVRPGITGWAQANGLRGPTDDADRAIARVDHDLAYIQNMSVSLDFWIMFLTVWREFFTGSGF